MCGRVATEIDHIRGSSPELSNLQSLCGACNRSKALAAVRLVTAESDPEAFARIKAQLDRLAARVAAVIPLKLCDDEDGWKASEPLIRSARKKARLIS